MPSRNGLQLLLVFALTPALYAGQVTSLAANDTVDWSTLGIGTTPPNPFTINSTSGAVTLSVTNLAPGASMASVSKVVNDPGSWFFPNVLDDQFEGPVGIAFSSPVFGVGMEVIDAFGAPLNATIAEYDGATLLGSYNVTNTLSYDSVAVDDASADITSIKISTGSNYFGLGEVELLDIQNPSPSEAPEPSTIALLAAAALVLAVKKRI